MGPRDLIRRLAPRGVSAEFKRARLSLERRVYRRRISAAEFREALLSLGEWRNRSVWVQASMNDFFNVDMRPLEVLSLLIDLVGPRGTLLMPAFPLDPDPAKPLKIDRTPTSTGLLTEMFRRFPGVDRSIHIHSSVAALGEHSAALTDAHHLDLYPWGELTPYGRLIEMDGLMVGLGIQTLGLTPLHNVECVLHHEVPSFEQVFEPDPITYSWTRSNGESGQHTTLLRQGRIWPGRLAPQLPSGIYKRFRLSNLSLQSAPAKSAVEAMKSLARRGQTMYVGL